MMKYPKIEEKILLFSNCSVLEHSQSMTIDDRGESFSNTVSENVH